MTHTLRPLAENPIHIQFGTAEEMMGKVARGELHGMVLCGPPGLGKTYMGEKVARRYGLPWKVHRPGSMVGLLRIIKKLKSGFAGFDDIDGFWDDPNSINVLKTFLSSGDRYLEHIVGGSPKNSIRRFAVPPGVGAIFLSNRNFFDPRQFKCDIAPVLDRCAVHSLSFDPLDAYEYTGYLAINGMLRGIHKKLTDGCIRHISLIETNEVLAHFAANASRYRNIAPRTVIKFAEWRIGEQYDCWSTLVDSQLLKEADRTRRLPADLHVFQIERKIGGVGVPTTAMLIAPPLGATPTALVATDPMALRPARAEAGMLADMMAAVAETGVPVIKTS